MEDESESHPLPSAASATDTLLRLLPTCDPKIRLRPKGHSLTPKPLAWSDGRCVQEAGTHSPRVSDTRILGIPGSRG